MLDSITNSCPPAMTAAVSGLVDWIAESCGSVDSVFMVGNDVQIDWTHCEGDDGEAPYGARSTMVYRWAAKLSLRTPDGTVNHVRTAPLGEGITAQARELDDTLTDSMRAKGWKVILKRVSGRELD